MQRTKKPAQAAADLPIAATEATPVVKKRASRSKEALAARAAAKAHAVDMGDYNEVSEADMDAMTAAREADLQADADAMSPGYKQAMAELSNGVGNSVLDDEIDRAVAALDEGNEVVRSLADIDVGTDPFAVTEVGIEEAALARLNARVAAIELQPGTVTRLPSGWDITYTEALGLNGQLREVVDILIVTGQWLPPAGEENEIAKYWPEIKQRLMDAPTGPDAIRTRRDAAKLAVAENDLAAHTGHLTSDEDYKTMTALHEEVLDLQGQLKDALAEHARDVEAMRHDLDVADIARAQAEQLTKDTLQDLTDKRVTIDYLQGRVDSLTKTVADQNIFIEGQQQACNLLGESLAEKSTMVRKLEIELSREKASNKILNTKLLAVFNRGPIARLFNRAA